MTDTVTVAETAAVTAQPPVIRRAGPLQRRVRYRRGDAIALAVLIVLPVLVFGLPAIAGHVVVPGDDLTQNFPLRVLVGRQIAGGHLPLFDPYLWSGSPLLADWNAGAAYPLTLLFAAFPAVAAWSLNLIVTWAVAGTGMFCFLRALRLGTVASFAGALTFAFAGAMLAQVAHLGLVAGMSWVPVQLLAVLRLAGQRGRASRLRWISVLAATFGLTILAGEPRAIDNVAVLVGLYALWLIIKAGRRAAPLVLSVLAGLALGICLGAIQLLPGLAAISTSQRAASSLALYNSGSLSPRWLLLMLVPDLLGGSGSFGQPAFFASYNLAEVTGYLGILPLIAAVALLTRLRLTRLRLRLRGPVPEWLIWQVVALVGIVLALGGKTPAGHLLVHVPLFGSQRLQSRNLMIADTGLAVLLAYWADDPLAGARRAVTSWTGRRWRPDLLLLVSLVPAGAVLVVAALATWMPRTLLAWLGVSARTIAAAGSLGPAVLPFAVLAVLGVGVVMLGRRLPPRRRRRLVAAFVVADVLVFTVLAVVQVSPGWPDGPPRAGVAVQPNGRERALTPSASASLRPIGALGLRGRFAVYDPGLADSSALTVIGSPDLNVLTGTPSVQGYSSIVNGAYARATGAHRALGGGQDVLSVHAVASGVLAQLDTSVLLTLPQYLISAGNAGTTAGETVAAARLGHRQLTAGGRATWYLGTTLQVRKISVPDPDAAQDAASGIEFGAVAPGGATRWQAARAAGPATLVVRLQRPAPAVAIVGRAGRKRADLAAPTLTEAGGAIVVVNGALQNALTPPQWGFERFDGPFAIFANRDARGALTAAGHRGRSAAGASVTVLSGPRTEPMSAAVSSPHGLKLTRAVASIPGWTATWHPAAGTAVPLTVAPAGVVQSVQVPAGTGVVTWAYEPPRFVAGLSLSMAALVLIAALAAGPAALRLARRRRRSIAAG